MKIRIEHIKPTVSEQQKKHERIKGLASSVFSEQINHLRPWRQNSERIRSLNFSYRPEATYLNFWQDNPLKMNLDANVWHHQGSAVDWNKISVENCPSLCSFVLCRVPNFQISFNLLLSFFSSRFCHFGPFIYLWFTKTAI